MSTVIDYAKIAGGPAGKPDEKTSNPFFDLNKRVEQLAEYAKQVMLGLTNDRVSAHGESPIEKLLLASLMLVAKSHGIGVSVMDHDDAFIAGEVYGGRRLTIVPQVRLKIDEDRFRADFIIFLTNASDEMAALVVECDGFEWHDRDKDQFIAERARNRKITMEGVPVVSFAGTEIWKDPWKCAEQVLVGLTKYNQMWGVDRFMAAFPINRESSMPKRSKD